MGHTARYIKWIRILILFVIAICVVWSIANISFYAYVFHPTPVVVLLGIVVGLSVAISVAAFVIAKNKQQQAPAIAGLVLFGIASGALQMMYYFMLGADVVTAIAFGWIGPVAEGVLSWLHASFELEPAKAKPTKVAESASAKSAKPAKNPAIASANLPASLPVMAEAAMPTDVPLTPEGWAVLKTWPKEKRSAYLTLLAQQGHTDVALAGLFNVVDTTIARNRDGRKPTMVAVAMNGNGHA